MAAINDVLVPPDAAILAPRRRLASRLAAGFVAGFVLTLALAAAGLLAYDARHEGLILNGVRVGGVDLSGLDRERAAAALGTAFGAYSTGRVVVNTTSGDVTVPFAEIGRAPDLSAMVDEALRTGRSGSVLERAVAEVRLAIDGTDIAPRVLFDRAALESRVRTAVATLRRPAADSRILMTGQAFYAIPALAGRTFDADAAVAAAVPILERPDAPAEVVVEAPGSDVPPAHGDAEALAATTAADRMIADVAVRHGKQQWTISAGTVRSWIRFEPRADGSLAPTVDEGAVVASLAKVSNNVRLEPVSATFLRNGRGTIVGVAAAKDGRQLDAPATAASIAAALAGRAGGAEVAPAPITAVTAPIAPKVSTADALQKGPLMVRLGTWKTWFPVNDHNFFGANIWVPARIIDGTVLQPGERFDWWRAVDPVTTARGFGPGGFIAGDHTEPTGALGGGMCSSSTTLFNAALRAGLQTGSRSNHRYYIYRYPLGLDATVSKTAGGGSQTMSFTNDMKTPIVIRTYRYRAGGKGWVRYEIWGIPDGRTTSLSKPAISNLQKAVTNTVYVSTRKPGTREQTEYPADRMDVSVSRVVRDRAGRVLHRDTYRSHYVLWNGVIEVGR